MAFDASPSWSGFNYQGKVALYYALKLINAEPVDTDLSNYSLMLESTEDFEIRHNEDPISFHQVKAYNSSSYSEYSDALFGITLELYKQPNVTGRIHTWKLINPKSNLQDLKASIQDDLNIILTHYRNTDPKDGSTVLEKAASDQKNITKTAAILRAAFKGDNSNQLYEHLESIFNEKNDALARLEAYQYEDGNKFCSLDDINSKIKSEIANALAKRGFVITNEQLEKTFHCFLGMIDKYIINRHKNKQLGEKIPISFGEIIHALDIEHEDIGKEYLACKFKEKFSYLIDEYISDPEDYTNQNQSEYCNLKEARKLLLGLHSQDLWEHYRRFSPQIYLQHSNNTENAIDINPEGIRHVLIKILHAINFKRASHNALHYKFIYRSTTLPLQYYLPTTITNIERLSQIERKIIANPNMSEILFEVDNLIYNGLEPHRFSPTRAVHTEAPIAENSDPRSKRDEILNIINLIPISTAQDALK
ncbi:hypothetical protein RGJ22_004290 [Serratia marcescens]|nr:hypothetical protein [Serratia marcescens]